MNNEEPIGQSIKRCADFLREVFRECQAFLVDVERLLDKIGFVNITGRQVMFWNTTDIHQPDAWGRHAFARIFSRGGGGADTRELLVLEVHLSPSCGADEPIVVLAHVLFDAPMASKYAKSLYNNGEWIERLLKSPYEFGVLQVFPERERRSVFPSASEVKATGWPLVKMKDRDDIARMIVTQAEDWTSRVVPRG